MTNQQQAEDTPKALAEKEFPTIKQGKLHNMKMLKSQRDFIRGYLAASAQQGWHDISEYSGEGKIIRWHVFWNCPIAVKPAPKDWDLPWVDCTCTNTWPEESFTPHFKPFMESPPPP